MHTRVVVCCTTHESCENPDSNKHVNTFLSPLVTLETSSATQILCSFYFRLAPPSKWGGCVMWTYRVNRWAGYIDWVIYDSGRRGWIGGGRHGTVFKIIISRGVTFLFLIQKHPNIITPYLLYLTDWGCALHGQVGEWSTINLQVGGSNPMYKMMLLDFSPSCAPQKTEYIDRMLSHLVALERTGHPLHKPRVRKRSS